MTPTTTQNASELSAKELAAIAKDDNVDAATKQALLDQETGKDGGNRVTAVNALQKALEPAAPPDADSGDDKPAQGKPAAPALAEPPPGAGRFDQNVHDPQAVGKANQALHDSGEGASPPAPAGIPGDEPPDPDRHLARIAPPAPTRFDGRDHPGNEAAQKRKS